jgi:hypothetical protein
LTAHLESQRELALLETALFDLSESLARADLELARCRSELEARATELLVIQAGSERRSLELSLTALERSIPGRERFGQTAKLLGASQASLDSP